MSAARRLVLVTLWCCVGVFAASCADSGNSEFEAEVADALEETLGQVVDPTPTAGPNPLLDPWAESVCEAIAAATPNLKAVILEDDPQLPLPERQQRVGEVTARAGTELRRLTQKMDSLDVPFAAGPVHAEAVGMYRRVVTVLQESVADWREAQTSEELDSAVLQLSRDVEGEYFRFSFSTDDEDPAVFGAIGRAGCDFQDPLGEWVLVGPVDVPIR